jgi:UDP-N-acetylmuramoylalanine--D-glutamate ligase
MIRALKAFKGLDHRCEWVRQLDGVTYINDSKGTNGGACAAAIAGFGSQLEGDGKVVLIAGGEAKGALLTELKEPLARFGRSVIAFGADRDIVSAAVEGSLPVIHADSLHQAVTLAKEEAAAGDLVLFSPACASFDMFRNFEHRGDAFKAEVAKL